jgi:hypothetical protein
VPTYVVEENIPKTKKQHAYIKAMLIVFSDIYSSVMADWVPNSQTINQHYYVEVLTELHELVRMK